ncbi:Enoyl-CoA hydratase/isomerase [Rhodomicrobium vannielii ATCC 17100]|uniref:enoyl-CoA hydratase n=1 Tax=Rhodomicrobium vannielii (strain ATCC 17100 / DSM 162 / LMG 4299 / NCIMB 10020 / ATH 3.1.1) TaxID=648757 RepID=E3I3E9_RHOVT|nr:enoyl-CoA hydratase [Rhodomicrobium vannielii]ADP72597.1 Enoyl-CoA hydratase/isomerase [Rhodomicrobium vannielii ATCC 17100]
MTENTEADAILVERDGRVAILRLNRPKALNALNNSVMRAMAAAIAALDTDTGVGVIVITGSDKAFAAGADIKEMADRSAVEMAMSDWFSGWDAVARCRTPLIAAVSGFALGGGCELAMMCDIIIASETAKFGQPEIKLGVIPGMGGSQRLTRAIGKYKAMDLILTGRLIDAGEADRVGLVSRVVQQARFWDDVMTTARMIAGFGKPSVIAAKETANRALEVSLAEGLLFERRVFHALFATEDQKEGMNAFVAKRPAEFRHR